MILNKKGTEKPIEIFVALFVILAVALLLLQLFQNQLTDKQQELEQFQRESKQQSIRSDANSYCRSRCSEASADGCSLRALATFCTSYASDRIRAPDFLDLNMNGVQDMDTTLLVGIGVCEDAVPCHAMISDCCGFQMSAASCKEYLTRYWSSVGHDLNAQNCLVRNTVRRGTCTGPTMTWYESAEFSVMAENCNQ